MFGLQSFFSRDSTSSRVNPSADETASPTLLSSELDEAKPDDQLADDSTTTLKIDELEGNAFKEGQDDNGGGEDGGVGSEPGFASPAAPSSAIETSLPDALSIPIEFSEPAAVEDGVSVPTTFAISSQAAPSQPPSPRPHIIISENDFPHNLPNSVPDSAGVPLSIPVYSPPTFASRPSAFTNLLNDQPAVDGERVTLGDAHSDWMPDLVDEPPSVTPNINSTEDISLPTYDAGNGDGVNNANAAWGDFPGPGGPPDESTPLRRDESVPPHPEMEPRVSEGGDLADELRQRQRPTASEQVPQSDRRALPDIMQSILRLAMAGMPPPPGLFGGPPRSSGAPAAHAYPPFQNSFSRTAAPTPGSEQPPPPQRVPFGPPPPPEGMEGRRTAVPLFVLGFRTNNPTDSQTPQNANQAASSTEESTPPNATTPPAGERPAWVLYVITGTPPRPPTGFVGADVSQPELGRPPTESRGTTTTSGGMGSPPVMPPGSLGLEGMLAAILAAGGPLSVNPRAPDMGTDRDEEDEEAEEDEEEEDETSGSGTAPGTGDEETAASTNNAPSDATGPAESAGAGAGEGAAPEGPRRNDLLTSLLVSIIGRMMRDGPAGLGGLGGLPGEGGNYEEFLRLAEIIGPARPRNATIEDVREQLPEVIWRASDLEDMPGSPSRNMAPDPAVLMEPKTEITKTEDSVSVVEEHGEVEPLHDAEGPMPTPPVAAEHAAAQDMVTLDSTGRTGDDSAQSTRPPRPNGYGVRDLLSSTREKCTICLSAYEEGDPLRILNCKHGFHVDCIDQWLTGSVNSCPMCRAPGVVVTSSRSQPPSSPPQPLGAGEPPGGFPASLFDSGMVQINFSLGGGGPDRRRGSRVRMLRRRTPRGGSAGSGGLTEDGMGTGGDNMFGGLFDE